jgi:hypothetical protein
VLPVLIFVAVAVPLLIVGAIVVQRSKASAEHPIGETDDDRRLEEEEFEEAERYQEQWREEHKHDLDQL